MFTYELRQPDSSTRVTVTLDRNGWSLLEFRHEGYVRAARFTDWHKLERGLQAMGLGPFLGVSAVVTAATQR